MVRKSYIWFVGWFLLAGCQTQEKRSLPSLFETYGKEDTRPFGASIAYTQFNRLFNDKYVETQTQPFDKTWDQIKYYSSGTRYSLYMLIARNISVTPEEAGAIRDYISEGNDMFIAADYIDPDLLDTIGVTTDRMDEIISEVHGKMKETTLSIDFGIDFKGPIHGYYYYPFLNAFSGYDSTNARTLGLNEAGKPDYIILFIGKGRLYLHAAPRAFSNYFLLTRDNYRYLENVLSYLRFEPKNIYWDEYYKYQSFRQKRPPGNGGGDNDEDKKFSSFDVIKKNPPLLWAFWLAVITLLLYILVNIKRKQRVINEVKPYTNTTVTFTETVGRLYLQKKNNRNIAEKMITYFYEHIRNSYFMNTAQVNDEFVNSLARKSGVSIEDTRQLFTAIGAVGGGRNVTDMELLQLNELIQKFYKNKT